jgi:diguanylate cyclase (GGDEF)-like protein
MNYEDKTKEELVKMVKEKDALIGKLSNDVTKDDMTDCLNKRAGMKVIKEKINESDINGTNLMVCFVDIDKFKKVNDTFGHKEGDNLLKKVCKIFKDNMRKPDIIVRMGGDEFLIIFPNTTNKEVNKIMNRVCKKVYEINIYNINLSYGVSEYLPKCGIEIGDLIDEADKKMYNEKEKNTN